MKKFITTTLPYSNASLPHVGAAFEFILADVIADYWRLTLGPDNVRLNIGLDEHGQKIAQKARELGLDPQAYVDLNAQSWRDCCDALGITYDNFYRTTDKRHKENVLRLTEQLSPFIYEREYSGWYCVGCESYKTEKELIPSTTVGTNYVPARCTIHRQECQWLSETVKCFDIQKFAPSIEDRLVDKSLSNELRNILANDFDFPITRSNVQWAIPFEDGTLHCWWEALQNYVFAAGLYDEGDDFAGWWANSLQLCGKDNLKFQAYIFQAILLAAGLPQTQGVLVHGTILDEKGAKMSKSEGNVVDPIAQLEKYGKGPLRYYLTLGINTYGDTAFSEEELVKAWNNEVVGGFGNLVARTLHLVDIQGVDVEVEPSAQFQERNGQQLAAVRLAFQRYDFYEVRRLLNLWVSELNRRINDERPFDASVVNRHEIIREIYLSLDDIAPFYTIILKDPAIFEALLAKKKVILFKKLEVAHAAV